MKSLISRVVPTILLAVFALGAGACDNGEPLEPNAAAISSESTNISTRSTTAAERTGGPADRTGHIHNQALAHTLRDLTNQSRQGRLRHDGGIAALNSLNEFFQTRGLSTISVEEFEAMQAVVREGLHEHVMQRKADHIGVMSFNPDDYLYQIYDQTELASSPSDLAIRIDPILDEARQFLTGEDLDAVLAVGSVAVESGNYWVTGHDEWYSYCSDSSATLDECQAIVDGGDGGGGGGEEIYPTGGLGTMAGGWNWKRTVSADVAGAMFGWWQGPGIATSAAGFSLVDGAAQVVEQIMQ